MRNNTKLEGKLEGAEDFQAWKYRVLLILEEHNLENYIKEEVAKPEGDEDKAKHKYGQGQEDHYQLHQGSLNPTCFILEDSQGDV